MRFGAVPVLAFALGCGDDGPSMSPMPDARPDAPPPVYVTGCDDPLVWTALAQTDGHLRPELRGGPCSGAQYPLSTVGITALGWPEYDRIARTCWRVVDASPGSGLVGGQEFSSAKYFGDVTLAGFARPVTIEARVLRDDGLLAGAVPPATFALDAAMIAEPDASSAIAVMTRDAWAERYAVHVHGQRIATDEIVDATAFRWSMTWAFTLHRTANGFVRREWIWNGAEVVQRELAVGPGTRARIAELGQAVVIDNELVIPGSGDTLYRIPLAAEPSELVGLDYGVLLHVGNSLVYHYIDSTTQMPATRSMSVGTGVLLPSWGDTGYFFDGVRFHNITTYPELSFEEQWSFSPRAEDLAMLGAPIAVHHGVIFGENGLLLAVDASSTRVGARFASAADLFGPGAHIGPIAAESAAYIVRRDDGTAAIYSAPFIDWCD